MSTFRVAAVLSYADAHTRSNFSKDLWLALLFGIRFDLTVLGYLLFPPMLLLFALSLTRRPSWLEAFSLWTRPYFLIVILLISFFLSLDFFYYAYFKDHINILVFAFFEDDTEAILKTVWHNYPLIPFLLAMTFGGWAIWQGLKKILPNFVYTTHGAVYPRFFRGLIYTAIFLLVGLGARGSLGLFPLGPDHTVISSNSFVNYLSYNGILAFYRATKLKIKQQTTWDANLRYYGYENITLAFADFYQIPIQQIPPEPLSLLEQQTKKNTWAEATTPHVVVIMMESFGSYWLQFHSPQFNLLGKLESHFKQDFLFKNTLPSSGSTIGSVGALLIGAPHRPEGPFLTESEFLQVPFRTSPARIYKQAGYETRFIYGGNPGWRDLYKFARHQGFEFVEGEVEIQNTLGGSIEKHEWGIYDEDLFKYVELTLKKATQPQFIVVLTTTNHPPYQVPKNFSPEPQKIPEILSSRLVGDRKIIDQRFKVYLYSNEKLGNFLTAIKTSTLREKTIVAATGDHNFWLINFEEQEQLAKWGVPIYFYIPKGIRPAYVPQTFASHMDIFPSLYNLSLSRARFRSFGVDIFNPQQEHFAFYFTRLSLGPDGAAFALKDKDAHYFDWQGDFQRIVPGPPSESKVRMATKYKALMSIMDYYFITEKKAIQTRSKE